MSLVWHQVSSENESYSNFSLMELLHPVRPTNGGTTSSLACPLSSTGCEVKHVLFTVVSHTLFVPVCSASLLNNPALTCVIVFP